MTSMTTILKEQPMGFNWVGDESENIETLDAAGPQRSKDSSVTRRSAAGNFPEPGATKLSDSS